MRKLIVILVSVVVLCVLITCVPYVLGLYTKTKLAQAIEQLNHENYSVHVKLQDYQRSWFSSQAKLEVDITDQRLLQGYRALLADSHPQSLTLTLNAHIAHGPVFAHHSPGHLFDASVGWAYLHGNLKLTNANNDATSADQQKTFAIIGLKLGFSGNSYIVLHYLPSEYSDNSLTVRTQGATGEWTINNTFDQITGDHINKPFVIQLGDVQLNISDDLRIQLNQQRTQYGFWLGTFNLQLPELAVTQSNQPVAAIKKVNITHDTTLSDKLLQTQTVIDVDKVDDGQGNAFGPLHMQFDVQHLDVDTINQMTALSQQLNIALLARSQVAEPDAESAVASTAIQQQMHIVALQQQLLSLVPKLLAKGANLGLNIMADMPDGTVHSKTTINFPVQQDVQQRVHLISVLNQAKANFMLAMPKPLMLTLTSYITAAQIRSLANENTDENTLSSLPSAELVAQSQQIAQTLLTHLVEQKMLIEQDDQYTFTLSYDQGTLQLNQQPTTLTALINQLTQSSAQVLAPPQAVPSAATPSQQQAPPAETNMQTPLRVQPLHQQ